MFVSLEKLPLERLKRRRRGDTLKWILEREPVRMTGALNQLKIVSSSSLWY
jgi:hypothetical protein